MTFDEKVEALVEKLGEDIAAAASDGDEFANGLMNAAILLLDQGSVSEVVIDEEDDLDDLDDDLDDEDDPFWNAEDENEYGWTTNRDVDDEDELPF